MKAKLIRLTREELYNRVWSEPMRTVAKGLGISDVGLAKQCRRLNIPRPERGYWAKKTAGHKVRKVALPPLPPNSTLPNQTLMFEGEKPEPPPSTGPVSEQREFERKAENRIIVQDSLRSPHPLVRKSFEALKNSAKRDTDVVGNWQERPLDIHVSKALLTRATRVIDAVIKAMESRGWKVSINTHERDRKTYVTVLGQRVAFGVRETIKKVENEPAKAVRSTYDGTLYTPYQTKYRDEPSGKLSMVIRSRWEGSTAVERSWVETATQPLEQRLNEFMVGVVEYADYWREWDRRREENERLRQEAERRRVEEQRRHQLELARGEALESQVVRWITSQNLGEYIAAVRAKAEAQPGGLDSSSLIVQWLDWAERYRSTLDPLQAPLDALLKVAPPKSPY